MREQSALMPKGIVRDNAGKWDMETRDVVVDVKTTVTVKLTNWNTCPVHLRLVSPFIVSTPKPWLVSTQRLSCSLINSACTILLNAQFHWGGHRDVPIQISLCDLRKPQPPLHQHWIRAYVSCSSGNRKENECIMALPVVVLQLSLKTVCSRR